EEIRVRALATSLGVANRLELMPWQPTTELAPVYRRAHCVLIPSRPTSTWVEQFGRVIVEAQASGAVVAGYASGSIPEVGGDAAILVSEGDVDGLASAVENLVGNADAYAARRAAAIAAAAEMTWDDVALRQARLY